MQSHREFENLVGLLIKPKPQKGSGVAVEEQQNTSNRKLSRREVLAVANRILTTERHFLKYPFFDLYKKSTRDVIEIRETIRNDNGEWLEVLWIVSRDVRSEFPSLLARKIFWKVIVPIIDTMSRPISQFIYLGPLREISRIVGENSRHRIKQALKDIVKTSIESQGTFFLKTQVEGTFKKVPVEDTFHLFNRVFYMGDELPDNTIADGVVIELGSYIHQNINNGYNVPIDWGFHHGLSGEIASRMYELLSLDFFTALEKGRQWVDKTYSRWCPYFPLVPQPKLWRVKKQFKDAMSQLLNSQYFGKYPEFINIPGQSSDWTIRLYAGPRAIEEYKRNKGKNARRLRAESQVPHVQSPQQAPADQIETPKLTPVAASNQVSPQEQGSGELLTPQQADFIAWLKEQGVTNARSLVLKSPWKDRHDILDAIKQDFLTKCDQESRGEFTFKKGKRPLLSWAVASENYQPPAGIETAEEREAKDRLKKTHEHNSQVNSQLETLQHSVKRLSEWMEKDDDAKLRLLRSEAQYAFGQTDEERRARVEVIRQNPETAIAEAKAKKEEEIERISGKISELKSQLQPV